MSALTEVTSSIRRLNARGAAPSACYVTNKEWYELRREMHDRCWPWNRARRRREIKLLLVRGVPIYRLSQYGRC